MGFPRRSFPTISTVLLRFRFETRLLIDGRRKADGREIVLEGATSVTAAAPSNPVGPFGPTPHV